MLLFVYGTLKSGQPANSHLAGTHFVGPAVTVPKYRLFDMGWHPAMVRDDEAGMSVQGELWDVGPELLPAIDEYESVPEGFVRRRIEVIGFAGDVEAYLYAKPVPPGTRSGTSWPIS